MLLLNIISFVNTIFLQSTKIMGVSNTIFNNSNTKLSSVMSYKFSNLDSGNMSSKEEKIFNTYKYWEPFLVPMQPVINGKKDSDGNPSLDDVSGLSTKSLFNNYNALFVNSNYREDLNMPLLDNPESRKNIRKKTACTIKDLVEASANGDLGRQIYNYSDFAYCKHLGRISNNYLITLRRFSTPCGDKIDIRSHIKEADKSNQHHMPDIGRMVTWMGTPGNDLNAILKYSYAMQWKDETAKIEDVETENPDSPLANIFNMTNANYRKQVLQGTQGSNYLGKKYVDGLLGGLPGGSTNPPYKQADWQKMYDSTKIYGPVDVIDTTKRRERGLKFEQKFELVFDYELRSYYGVNGKAAFTDLIANILATTYTHGTFWGGERRFIGNSQDNVFANLPIFKLAESGDFTPSSVYRSFIDSVQQTSQAFAGGLKGDTTYEKIKNLAKDIGGMLLGGALNKLGRPQKMFMSSLLSGAPVGCWHLTIGNPFSPILEVGNLVCTGTEIEHYGPLGLDDFPTGIRVKVALEHGKPRDIMGIEQMYNRGDTRIYSPMGNKVLDMYKNASSIKKSTTRENNIAERMKKKINTDGSVQDVAGMPAVQENANNVTETKSKDEDIASLMRYFGMTDSSMISIAGAEALYGSEKQKNAHVKKGTDSARL